MAEGGETKAHGFLPVTNQAIIGDAAPHPPLPRPCNLPAKKKTKYDIIKELAYVSRELTKEGNRKKSAMVKIQCLEKKNKKLKVDATQLTGTVRKARAETRSLKGDLQMAEQKKKEIEIKLVLNESKHRQQLNESQKDTASQLRHNNKVHASQI